MIAQMTLDQAFGLYNYWIVIFLMMTGFYLVIARGNLIKTIIGLNIFQTSVVLLYVTMGKVTGPNAKGAPIMPLDAGHGHGHDSHGHEKSHEHGAEHGHGMDHSFNHPPSGRVGHEVAGEGESLSGNIIENSTLSERAVVDGGSTLPEGEYLQGAEPVIQLASFEDAAHSHDASTHVVEAAEVIYSNPLPSVLMLTAIVVGVATTALALALTVRVREEYGTIEEDEILELDRAE